MILCNFQPLLEQARAGTLTPPVQETDPGEAEGSGETDAPETDVPETDVPEADVPAAGEESAA